MSEEKRKPFQTKFVSLGAEVDFGKIDRGDIVLSNKEGRIGSIGALVE